MLADELWLVCTSYEPGSQPTYFVLHLIPCTRRARSRLTLYSLFFELAGLAADLPCSHLYFVLAGFAADLLYT